MPGGRMSHNLNGGFSEVLVEGRLDSTNQWSKSYTNASNSVSGLDAGYLDISQYTQPNTVNTFSNRYGRWSHSGGNRVDGLLELMRMNIR